MRVGLKSHVVLVFIITMGLARLSFAQNPSQGNAVLASAYLKTVYQQQMARQLRLYNGTKYVDYNVYYNDKAYFISGKLQSTTLYYDGSIFENVPALYDMYREMVAVRYTDTADKVTLINSRLDSFNMSGHSFIRIDAGANIKPGFYEVLYNGNTQLLKKYTIGIEDDRSGQFVKHLFYQKTTLYVRNKGVYNSVSGGRALLSQLKNKRKELNEYLGTNKLNTRLEEEEMVKLLYYYDSLTN